MGRRIDVLSGVKASVLARSDNPSKQRQFTPSERAAGSAASMKARSDNPSKQYRGEPRSVWTIEAQETFYNAAIVHGWGRWSKIADSIPNIDTLQVKNFGNVYEDWFPTEYEEIVISCSIIYTRRKTTI